MTRNNQADKCSKWTVEVDVAKPITLFGQEKMINSDLLLIFVLGNNNVLYLQSSIKGIHWTSKFSHCNKKYLELIRVSIQKTGTEDTLIFYYNTLPLPSAK